MRRRFNLNNYTEERNIKNKILKIIIELKKFYTPDSLNVDKPEPNESNYGHKVTINIISHALRDKLKKTSFYEQTDEEKEYSKILKELQKKYLSFEEIKKYSKIEIEYDEIKATLPTKLKTILINKVEELAKKYDTELINIIHAVNDNLKMLKRVSFKLIIEKLTYDFIYSLLSVKPQPHPQPNLQSAQHSKPVPNKDVENSSIDNTNIITTHPVNPNSKDRVIQELEPVQVENIRQTSNNTPPPVPNKGTALKENLHTPPVTLSEIPEEENSSLQTETLSSEETNVNANTPPLLPPRLPINHRLRKSSNTANSSNDPPVNGGNISFSKKSKKSKKLLYSRRNI